MKNLKTKAVVITLLSAIIILLCYMIVTKSLIGSSSNSPIILLQAENENNDPTKESSIENSNDIQKNIARSATTSRGGSREQLNPASEEAIIDTSSTNNESETQPIEESVQEQTQELTQDVIDEPVQEPVEKAEEIENVEEEIKPSYEGVTLEYDLAYNITSGHLTKSKGVVYYNGHKETYYSQRVLPGKGLKMLNNNGRHVANDGTVRDGDGYIAVACNYLSKGSTLMTSLGPGKVYDTGGMTGKWIDIYVNW